MNNYNKITILFSAFITLIVIGCSTDSPKIPSGLQEAFQQQIAIKDMNKSLMVTAETLRNEPLHFGSQIHVIIKNVSDQQVRIRAPEGIKLFIINDGKWFEVNDNNEYFGDVTGAILFPTGPQELRDRKSTWVSPILQPGIKIAEANTILRILIIGETVSSDSNTGIPVAAYTDVSLTP